MEIEDLRKFVRKNKKELINHFIQKSKANEEQLLVCMAGSSGAGKTESAKAFMEDIGDNSIIRIDADDIKEWISKKTSANINDCHIPASVGVDILCDECFKKKKNFIIDGTFTRYDISSKNVERALSPKRNYTVFIIYVYQEPKLAWEFIQKRAEITGRKVPFETFKKTFIKSIENMIKIKQDFKENVIINTIKKNFAKSTQEYTQNVNIIYLQKLYKAVKIQYQDLN